jgi:hypothetical protein
LSQDSDIESYPDGLIGKGGDMGEPWRELRVGDRIRVVRMPSGVDAPGYIFHRDTRRLYKRLIERRRSLRICRIDDWGLPWIRCQFKRKDGRWEYHSLAVNDDSWVLVQRRNPADAG